jgi:hypothetical protein
MSAAYCEALRTHEQWSVLNSTPSTLDTMSGTYYEALRTQALRTQALRTQAPRTHEQWCTQLHTTNPRQQGAMGHNVYSVLRIPENTVCTKLHTTNPAVVLPPDVPHIAPSDPGTC